MNHRQLRTIHSSVAFALHWQHVTFIVVHMLRRGIKPLLPEVAKLFCLFIQSSGSLWVHLWHVPLPSLSPGEITAIGDYRLGRTQFSPSKLLIIHACTCTVIRWSVLCISPDSFPPCWKHTIPFLLLDTFILLNNCHSMVCVHVYVWTGPLWLLECELNSPWNPAKQSRNVCRIQVE